MSTSAQGPTEVIARRVAELRARKNMTRQELGERLAELDVPWNRFTVSSLENGKRQNVTVVELLALARVLDVAPLNLLVPLEEISYQVTPNEEQPADRVRDWIRGVAPLPGMNQRIYFSEVPMVEMRARFRRGPATDDDPMALRDPAEIPADELPTAYGDEESADGE